VIILNPFADEVDVGEVTMRGDDGAAAATLETGDARTAVVCAEVVVELVRMIGTIAVEGMGVIVVKELGPFTVGVPVAEVEVVTPVTVGAKVSTRAVVLASFPVAVPTGSADGVVDVADVRTDNSLRIETISGEILELEVTVPSSVGDVLMGRDVTVTVNTEMNVTVTVPPPDVMDVDVGKASAMAGDTAVG